MFDNVCFNEMKQRLAISRHDALKQMLADEGSVAVAELARRLDVSEMTVRRDLRELEGQGALARVHGGAVAGASLRFGSRLAHKSCYQTLSIGFYCMATFEYTECFVYLG